MKAAVSEFDFGLTIGVRVYADDRGSFYVYLASEVGRAVGAQDLAVQSSEPGAVPENMATLEMPREIAIAVYRTLADHFTRQGIPPATESELKGRLEATERHLEDMRRIALERVEPLAEDEHD